jgi:ribosomal protein L37E
MSKGDGKNPKFRILCKRCNSYQAISLEALYPLHVDGVLQVHILCNKCGNSANSFDEEAS